MADEEMPTTMVITEEEKMYKEGDAYPGGGRKRPPMDRTENEESGSNKHQKTTTGDTTAAAAAKTAPVVLPPLVAVVAAGAAAAASSEELRLPLEPTFPNVVAAAAAASTAKTTPVLMPPTVLRQQVTANLDFFIPLPTRKEKIKKKQREEFEKNQEELATVAAGIMKLQEQQYADMEAEKKCIRLMKPPEGKKAWYWRLFSRPVINTISVKVHFPDGPSSLSYPAGLLRMESNEFKSKVHKNYICRVCFISHGDNIS